MGNSIKGDIKEIKLTLGVCTRCGRVVRDFLPIKNLARSYIGSKKLSSEAIFGKFSA